MAHFNLQDEVSNVARLMKVMLEGRSTEFVILAWPERKIEGATTAIAASVDGEAVCEVLDETSRDLKIAQARKELADEQSSI